MWKNGPLRQIELKYGDRRKAVFDPPTLVLIVAKEAD